MNFKSKLTSQAPSVRFIIVLAALVAASLAGATHTTYAQIPAAEKVIYSFAPATGFSPEALARDSAGNLYAAARNGGTNRSCSTGCGSILQLSSSGRATVLYNFGRSGSGLSSPTPSGLARDSQGNLYTATTFGSPNSIYGSVFKLTPSGSAGALYSFQGGNDGWEPVSGVTLDSGGNLYGTTILGGGTGCSRGEGCGIVYRVTRSGIETVLYRFTGGADGSGPEGSPTLDSAGNLYGTAVGGGDLSCTQGQGGGCGTVWKLDTSGKLTVLYTFTGGTDGAFAKASLVMDSSGNSYGVAAEGGDLSCNFGFGCGVVFKIDSSGNFSVLHTFVGGTGDGQIPGETLLGDPDGNLYGTTSTGGSQACAAGCGVVFKLDASNNETILHFFAGGATDGSTPDSALITDDKGNLYGITVLGGVANGGTIFKVQTQ